MCGQSAAQCPSPQNIDSREQKLINVKKVIERATAGDIEAALALLEHASLVKNPRAMKRKAKMRTEKQTHVKTLADRRRARQTLIVEKAKGVVVVTEKEVMELVKKRRMRRGREVKHDT